MKIRLSHSFVKELSLVHNIDEGRDSEPDFTLNTQALFRADNLSDFIVAFDVEINSPSEYKIKILYASVFITDEDIDQNFRLSHFPVVNAPAIAFPYLRSLITTITVNSGFAPAILPSINFTKFKNKLVYLDDAIISEDNEKDGDKPVGISQ